MDYRQARLELKKGKLHSLYLFSGSEEILKEELLAEMIELLRQRGLDPELQRLDGKKLGWTELLREYSQLTIFSQGRLMLVKDAPYFQTAASGNAKGPAKQEVFPSKKRLPENLPEEHEFAAILADQTRNTLLVFSVPDVDRRRKLSRYLEKKGVLIDFPAPQGAMLLRWIRDELSREAIEIDEDALGMLLQRSGENLSVLKKELEKLTVYLGAKKHVDCSAVEKIVAENAESNIFRLVDELGRKNGVAAVNHLMKMRRQNEHPLRILAMITRHFRLLYHAALLQQQGVTVAKLPAALQVPPFAAQKLLEQLPKISSESLPRIIILLKETDVRIKTGRIQGEEALEQLVFKLSFMQTENKI